MVNVEIKELIHDIVRAKTELDAATRNYDFAVGDDMVDLCSYRIIESQIKYNMLLKMAKTQGLAYTEFMQDNLHKVNS